MAVGRQSIDVARPDIDRKRAEALNGIDEIDGAVAVADLADRFED